MRKLLLLTATLLFPLLINAGKNESPSPKVTVYYFHYTQRCKTCQAIETETKKTVETDFADQIKKGTVSFESVNLDETKNNALAKKWKVSSQTLLIVSGSKSKDLTDDAFRYAMAEPGKLNALIRSTVNGFLNPKKSK